MDATESLTIQEVARRTGLSTHTLRYYERSGLIYPVGRSSSGHRRYSADDLGWLEFLKKLRATGMPIREMRRYAELVLQGEHTVSARRRLLESHRDRIVAQLCELSEALGLIERKINWYRDAEPPEQPLELVAEAGAPQERIG